MAILLRTRAPGVPLLDLDTYSYIMPALSQLSGSGFCQTFLGRDLAYPLFLLAVLKCGGDYYTITTVQHVSGILSGFVWWATWLQWAAWLPARLDRAWWVRLTGLAFLALYLWNANAIRYEESIRPEGIFPMLALVQIWLCLLYARARWKDARIVPMMCYGGAAILVSFIAYSTKPSWGFASLVPVLVVALGLIGKTAPPNVILRASPLALGGALAVVWLLFVPWSVGWIPDERAKDFLPKELFCLHAPIIAKTIRMRVEKGGSSAEEEAYLGRLEAKIEESRRVTKSFFHFVLGHNPETLLYHSNLLDEIPHCSDAAQRRRYMYRAYFEALVAHPSEMLLKVLRQLRLSVSDLSLTLYGENLRWKAFFQQSLRAMDTFEAHDAMRPELPLGHVYERVRAETRSRVGAIPKKVAVAPPVPDVLLQRIGPPFLALWVCAWPLLAVRIAWRRARSHGDSLRDALLVTGIFWASCLGTSLTVAVANSFDTHRYLHLLSALHSLLMAAGIVLAIAWFRGIRWPSRARA
ncbi:MAG: hypothetical protein FGM15_08725 [Chthoniobacterales bacterium]|nr:hypothetical protein [Chthoniobacterales bacterium]